MSNFTLLIHLGKKSPTGETMLSVKQRGMKDYVKHVLEQILLVWYS